MFMSQLTTVEECCLIFKAEEYGYTDEELIQMHDFLFKLSKIFYESYTTTLRSHPTINTPEQKRITKPSKK